MSVKVMGFVWDCFPGGGGELLTALALADHASHDGGDIYPRMDKIARMTRQSVRTVQRHIRKMEREGWLQMVKKGGDGPGDANHYRMPMDLDEIARNARPALVLVE